MEHRQLDELVLRIAVGDRAAFAALYEEMKSPVFGLALAVLRRRDEAEDVMQDTFLRVWNAAGQHRPGEDARAWVMTIARNLSYMAIRRRRPTDEVDEQTPNPRSSVDGAVDRVLLDQLFTALDDVERQIVVLYAVGGYSHKEIAAILDKPHATIRWKFRRALRKLSDRMAESDAHRAQDGVLPTEKGGPL